jgi:hypothetical protein
MSSSTCSCTPGSRAAACCCPTASSATGCLPPSSSQAASCTSCGLARPARWAAQAAHCSAPWGPGALSCLHSSTSTARPAETGLNARSRAAYRPLSEFFKSRATACGEGRGGRGPGAGPVPVRALAGLWRCRARSHASCMLVRQMCGACAARCYTAPGGALAHCPTRICLWGAFQPHSQLEADAALGRCFIRRRQAFGRRPRLAPPVHADGAEPPANPCHARPLPQGHPPRADPNTPQRQLRRAQLRTCRCLSSLERCATLAGATKAAMAEVASSCSCSLSSLSGASGATTGCSNTCGSAEAQGAGGVAKCCRTGAPQPAAAAPLHHPAHSLLPLPLQAPPPPRSTPRRPPARAPPARA